MPLIGSPWHNPDWGKINKFIVDASKGAVGKPDETASLVNEAIRGTAPVTLREIWQQRVLDLLAKAPLGSGAKRMRNEEHRANAQLFLVEMFADCPDLVVKRFDGIPGAWRDVQAKARAEGVPEADYPELFRRRFLNDTLSLVKDARKQLAANAMILEHGEKFTRNRVETLCIIDEAQHDLSFAFDNFETSPADLKVLARVFDLPDSMVREELGGAKAHVANPPPTAVIQLVHRAGLRSLRAARDVDAADQTPRAAALLRLEELRARGVIETRSMRNKQANKQRVADAGKSVPRPVRAGESRLNKKRKDGTNQGITTPQGVIAHLRFLSLLEPGTVALDDARAYDPGAEDAESLDDRFGEAHPVDGRRWVEPEEEAGIAGDADRDEAESGQGDEEVHDDSPYQSVPGPVGFHGGGMDDDEDAQLSLLQALSQLTRDTNKLSPALKERLREQFGGDAILRPPRMDKGKLTDKQQKLFGDQAKAIDPDALAALERYVFATELNGDGASLTTPETLALRLGMFKERIHRAYLSLDPGKGRDRAHAEAIEEERLWLADLDDETLAMLKQASLEHDIGFSGTEVSWKLLKAMSGYKTDYLFRKAARNEEERMMNAIAGRAREFLELVLDLSHEGASDAAPNQPHLTPTDPQGNKP